MKDLPAGRILAIVAVGLLVALPLGAGEHVRVVLDTSKSMRTTDSGGLARLSTALLFDLANPDLNLDDSFAVLPFHPTDRWTSPQDPPPTRIGSRLEPVLGRRQAFVEQLRNLAYDAEWTYFYPGLKAALAELEAIQGAQEVRTIVILTDGLPESPTRAEELRRIQDELQPRLEQAGVRLYVLAFGAQAHGQHDFFDRLIVSGGGRALGEVFVDPDGRNLVATMIRVFTHAFGYSQDAPQPLPAASSVDLEGGSTPTKAAVVVYSSRAQPAPSLGLREPAGAPRQPNLAGGVATARDLGASYAVQWVLAPFPGRHGLKTDATTGTVAVLRPTLLQLELRSRSGGPLRAMARTPLPFGVLMRSSAGAGPPGEAQISFQPQGPRLQFDRQGQAIYSWNGRVASPPSGASRLIPEGRLYDAEVSFERDPAEHEPFYVGHLEVEARRGLARVGGLQGAWAARVEVYPLLAIIALPSIDSARVDGRPPRALSQGERACGRFALKLDVGRLPHPHQPIWPLRAQLAPGITWSGALEGAQLTLDGLPLEVAGAKQPPSQPPAEWSKGRALGRELLLGDHEVCLRVGQPTQADSQELKLAIQFTLLESPYDEFSVVESFVLKALIDPPTFLDRWWAIGVLGLGLLALLLAVWYLRDRPDLPLDLRYSLIPEGQPAAAPAPQMLPRGPFWQPLLGLVEERPLTASGRVLAWLRPTREDLFRLKPAPRMTFQRQEAEPSAEGNAIRVQRFYRLEDDKGAYVLRVEYEP